MWKKIAAAAGTGAVILGAGGAAMAATGSNGQAATTSNSASAAHAKAHHRELRGIHDTFVTGNATKGFVTHDGIRGLVTAVSPTSISVKASDRTTDTFVVGSATKVHVKADGKRVTGNIDQVKVGDHARVLGTGTTTLTAKHIRDGGAK